VSSQVLRVCCFLPFSLGRKLGFLNSLLSRNSSSINYKRFPSDQADAADLTDFINAADFINPSNPPHPPDPKITLYLSPVAL
jgi:hypothetical protein